MQSSLPEFPLRKDIHPSIEEWAQIVAKATVPDVERRPSAQAALVSLIGPIVEDERFVGRTTELAIKALCQLSLRGKGPNPRDAAKAVANKHDCGTLPQLFKFEGPNADPLTSAERQWREVLKSSAREELRLIALAMLAVINKERIRWHLRLAALSLIGTAASLPQIGEVTVSLCDIIAFCVPKS